MSLQLPEPQDDSGPGQPLPGGLAAGQDQEEDPLTILQGCIQTLPEAIAALHDPQDVQDAIQALGILARIQTRLMKSAGPGAAQAQ